MAQLKSWVGGLLLAWSSQAATRRAKMLKQLEEINKTCFFSLKYFDKNSQKLILVKLFVCCLHLSK